MTTPAFPAAGVHLPWAQVPGEVRSWAAVVGGGGAPQSVRDLRGGFSPGAVARLDFATRAIFVKAVGAELNPESPEFHRREAALSAALPPAPELPRLLSSYDDGNWVALAFEAVEGRPPAHPWDHRELDLAVRALEALHTRLTPNPAPVAPTAEMRLEPLFGGWSELAALSRPPAGLDPWAQRNLSRLVDVESAWRSACAGPTLLHGDVRSDNVLITSTGVVFVDWPHACVGHPVFDVIAWAPSVQLEGGIEPEELLARHAPSRSADPDAVTALIAAFAGFLVSHSLRPAPPGLPTIRAFQAAQGERALAWLRRRRGW